jgi:hypothetical protein
MFPYNPRMHLWLLRPQYAVLARSAHPWEPPFDKTFGILVRAETEADARRLANEKAGYEGRGVYLSLGVDEDEVAEDVWLDEKWTTCRELEAEGEPGVILVDRHEGVSM